MQIAIIGYGKMGQAIERAALLRNHEVVLRITTENSHELTKAHLQKADVAIEFTAPAAAAANLVQCIDAGVNVVSGTTGWNDQLQRVQEYALANGTGMLHASNFSIGVNIFFEVNKLLAQLMNGHSEYDVFVDETHHVHKKDKPGGTAITLAEQIVERIKNKKGWALDGRPSDGVVPIHAARSGEVPGTHQVKYTSAIDDIEIIHTAHSRDGFALGAVMAAEFIAGKSGIFNMKDVLGIR